MEPTLATPPLLAPLQSYVQALTEEFYQIPEDRKALLGKLTQYIQAKVNAKEPIALTFICTHNSRRSHLSQLWGQVAAYYYHIPQVQTYSGGTEATAFNSRAVHAVEKAGFKVEKTENSSNPVYLVHYAAEQPPVKAFSKVYDEGGNPRSDFGAVMTCTHADENCPFIPGATRISLPYDDPKAFDDTPEEAIKYAERTRQIGQEILYAFSQVKVPVS
jgi:arsenate reductase (thioredoxin)